MQCRMQYCTSVDSPRVSHTYVHLAIDYVNETAQHNDEVKDVPGVAEVVLQCTRRYSR